MKINGKNITSPTMDSSAAYCKQACEKSLKTLGIDCIDLCKFLFFDWLPRSIPAVSEESFL